MNDLHALIEDTPEYKHEAICIVGEPFTARADGDSVSLYFTVDEVRSSIVEQECKRALIQIQRQKEMDPYKYKNFYTGMNDGFYGYAVEAQQTIPEYCECVLNFMYPADDGTINTIQVSQHVALRK